MNLLNFPPCEMPGPTNEHKDAARRLLARSAIEGLGNQLDEEDLLNAILATCVLRRLTVLTESADSGGSLNCDCG